MGRRLLFTLGILLLAPSALVPLRAQDAGGPPPVEAPPADPAALPPVKPSELPALDAPAPAESPAQSPRAGTRPARKSGDRKERAGPDLALPGPTASAPAFSPVPGPDSGPPAAAPEPARAAVDPSIERADGPAMPAEPGGSPERGDRLTIDRLPAGKQSVSVTVNIQSPAHMNLHKPATVRLYVRNTGTSDALQVRIRDELPEGLKFVSSVPPPAPADPTAASVLTWSLGTMAAGTESVIAVKVEPIRPGPLEHGASVTFQTGSKSRTEILQPKLRIEQIPSARKILKGQEVEFKVVVTNVGNGPARKVTVGARLTDGLRPRSGERGTGELVSEPIGTLQPNESMEIDPLVAVAVKAGEQTSTVVARSLDVVVLDKAEEARAVANVTVQEPALELALDGPKRQYTDTVAQYEIALKNPGTAPARRVRVAAFVPPGSRLLAVPKGARYDPPTRRILWSIDKLDPNPMAQKLTFDVKVGDVGNYEIKAEAAADGNLKKTENLVTEVFGMPDIDLSVEERQRVVNVGGKTHFLIVLRNKGTKEATNIRLSAAVSKNLEVTGGLDVPSGFQFLVNSQDGKVVLQDAEKRGIPRIGPGGELVLGLEVKAVAAQPEAGTCRVFVTHDGLSDTFEDMALVKILTSSGQPTEPAGK